MTETRRGRTVRLARPARFKRVEVRQETPLEQFARSRGALGGRWTRSGVRITEDTALKISAVFCAVRIRSGILSSLPVDVFERRGSGLSDVKVHQHPVAALLQRQPNPAQVPAVFAEQTEAHLALWGNAFAELSFDLRTAEVAAAVNHHPGCVEPFLDDADRTPEGWPRLKYRIREAAGVRVLDASQVAHVPGFGFNGLVGLSVISLAAESFGIAVSGDNLAATFNGSAAKPFLVVEHPEYLDDGPFERLSREIREEYRGEDSFGSLLLEGGAKAHAMNLPLKDAQFLESRKFQGEEISARWFGLPPHLAGYLDRAHFDNVEEQDRALLTFTLAPGLVRREQEWNRKLFTGDDRGRFYVKHNVDALLRGQTKERYEAHKSALMAGWKTVNEVRALEELPPLPGGDEAARPASIWGPQPADTAPSAESPALTDTRSDPRLFGLAVEVLSGLQAAEKIQAERWARQRDGEQRLREWYEGHERKALDKLAALRAEARNVLDHYRRHRDQLLTALKSPEPVAAVAAAVEGWRDDPAALAARLV